MDPQIINTGDPQQDREIAQQIKEGIEEGGMKAEIKDNPGGGVAIYTNMTEQAAPSAAEVAAASKVSAGVTLDPGAYELGGPEAYNIKQEMYQGNISKLREFLKKSLAEKDWNNRWFMLDVLISNVSHEVLDQAVEAEPNNAEVYLMRGAHFTHKAWMERGSETADKVTEEQWESAAKQVVTAIPDLQKAAELEPSDPTPKVYLMQASLMFTKTRDLVDQSYAEAIKIDPNLLVAHACLINSKTTKWGGSLEESLGIARKLAASAKEGSNLYSLLFYAHLHHVGWLKFFEENESEANAYMKNEDVNKELSEAFDKWISASYKLENYAIPYLHCAAYWFYKTGDKVRLKKAMQLINNVMCSGPWGMEPEKTAAYAKAYQMAMS